MQKKGLPRVLTRPENGSQPASQPHPLLVVGHHPTTSYYCTYVVLAVGIESYMCTH